MRCHVCGSDTTVLETRQGRKTVNRRRMCTEGHIYWTKESFVRICEKRPDNRELKEKAATLEKEGFSHKRIILELGISAPTFYRWKKQR